MVRAWFKMQILLLLWSFLIDYVHSNNVRIEPRVDPLVLTSKGLVRGERSSDGQYSAFLGIPYAQVDNDNPFGKSLPHPGFGDTVFNAYNGSIACPQWGEEGTLDCLRLNIYVPTRATSRNPMPVLVWIHGGAFFYGKAGRLAGYNLINQDIVVVHINYRLGAYGFLCLDTPQVPGNQGLKDQLAALRWIRENIASFGGNPYNVTIAGQSAGSASVEYHMYSPQEKLYHKAILQSGTSQPLFFNADTNAAFKLSKHLGFNTTDQDQALRFLAAASPNLVVAAASELRLTLGPCKEKSFSGVEIFIETDPFSFSNPRKIANTPIMIGSTSKELHRLLRVMVSSIEDVFKSFLEKNFNLAGEDFERAEALIRHFYIGDEAPSSNVQSELEEFYSDITFAHPIERSISKLLGENSGRIYQYVYNYSGENDQLEANKVPHGSELGYLFANDYDNFNEEQKKVSKTLISLWSSFIKTGNPTPTTTDLVPVIWEPVGVDTRPYLAIESSIHLENRFRRESMAFWDLFYRTYGRYTE